MQDTRTYIINMHQQDFIIIRAIIIILLSVYLYLLRHHGSALQVQRPGSPAGSPWIIKKKHSGKKTL